MELFIRAQREDGLTAEEIRAEETAAEKEVGE